MAGRILIADDVATNRIVLKVKLASAFYEVVQADSGRAALDLAVQERPDLIVLDLQMADIDGVSVCKALRANPATEHIPIIMVTAVSDKDAKMAALKAGADDFLYKPINELILLARVRSLLRARDTEEELRLRASTCRELGFAEANAMFEHPGHVGVVAAQKETAVRWKAALQAKTKNQIRIFTRETVLTSLAEGTVPDVFVIAADLERSDDGLRLLSELKSRAETRHSPVVAILRHPAHNQSVMALDLGANDLMDEEFDPEELALRVETQIKRKRQADRLRESVHDGLRMAVIDPLTGLYNRRYALPHMARIAERAQEQQRPFPVMILDLDRFKTINDSHGHGAGDQVLVEVARRIRENLRAVDLVARIGGEEFLIAMPDTSLAEARIAAERLRQVVEETPVTLENSNKRLHITMSIGVAMGGARVQSVTELLAQADRALYAAKSDGRNQVMVNLSAA